MSKIKYICEDVSNLAHRIFHSLNSQNKFSTIEDFEENRGLYIHNIINTIEWDRKKFEVDMKHTILAFDSNSWRLDYLNNSDIMSADEYKAGRSQEHKKFIRELIETVYYITIQMNYIVLKEQNYEADDLIALFVKKFNSEDIEFVVISNDDDFTQLKKYNCTVYSPNAKKFNEKDADTVEIKIIKGDGSDNIQKLNPEFTINNELVKVNFSETDINKLVINTFGSYNNFDRDEFKEVVANTISDKIFDKAVKVLKESLRTDELTGRELTKITNEKFFEEFSKSLGLTVESKEDIDGIVKDKVLKRYVLNENLIDFKFIPNNLVEQFNSYEIHTNDFSLEEMKKTLICFKLNVISNYLKP